MKKFLIVLAILVLVALLVLGCTRGPNYQYPTGYAGAGGQQQVQQGYVGGGCAVEGPEPTLGVDVSGPIAAA